MIACYTIYPLTPTKVGVHHPNLSLWGQVQRWIPFFNGMSGKILLSNLETRRTLS